MSTSEPESTWAWKWFNGSSKKQTKLWHKFQFLIIHSFNSLASASIVIFMDLFLPLSSVFECDTLFSKSYIFRYWTFMSGQNNVSDSSIIPFLLILTRVSISPSILIWSSSESSLNFSKQKKWWFFRPPSYPFTAFLVPCSLSLSLTIFWLFDLCDLQDLCTRTSKLLLYSTNNRFSDHWLLD